MVALEDAGFEIRDTLMWLYGSGFPKSHNIGKAVDKLQDNQRDVIKHRTFGGRGGTSPTSGSSNGGVNGGFNYKDDRTITKGTSKGEGWGTNLKPAYEPIVLSRKPFKGSITENVLEHGTGGINIDECRVGKDKIVNNVNDFSNQHGNKWGNGEPITKKGESVVYGRFPANVMHDGSDETTKGMWDLETDSDASRYFYCAKASKKDRDEGLDNRELKQTTDGNIRSNIESARKFEANSALRRNTHPTVKPTELMQYLVRLITPKGGTVLDPFMVVVQQARLL